MGRTGVLQEIRMLRFEEIDDRFTKGRLSAAEAAEWLGVSERTFRRQRSRYDDEGLSGLQDRRLGKVSPHRVPALDRQVDLIVTLDDATSEIYSAFLVEEEGTASTFQGLLEVFQAHGLPCALYTDRGSHIDKQACDTAPQASHEP